MKAIQAIIGMLPVSLVSMTEAMEMGKMNTQSQLASEYKIQLTQFLANVKIE